MKASKEFTTVKNSTWEDNWCVGVCVCVGCCCFCWQNKGDKEELGEAGEYNVYSTFQSHEPDFDYLKSLEIEEKINKIRWLPQQNAAQFLLSTNGEQETQTNQTEQNYTLQSCWAFGD